MYIVFNRCSPCSQPWDECSSFGHACYLARTLARLYQSPSYVMRGHDVVVIAEGRRGCREYVPAQMRRDALSGLLRQFHRETAVA